MKTSSRKEGAQNAEPVKMKDSEPGQTPKICKFEELKGQYKIMREIGRGSYGVVFKAVCTVDYDSDKGLEYYDRDEVEDDHDGIQRFAVKRIFPTINAPYILIEMYILKYIKGHEFVTNLVAGYRQESQVSLVFEYQRSQSFLVFVESISQDDIKCYLFQLLSAVKHLSDLGIVHRDIKPSNFLWDPKSRKGILIDFGLSEVETDENGEPIKNPENDLVQKIVDLQRKMSIKHRTGTKGYMPPETIFNSPNQGSKVDIWAVGVIMLSFLMRRHPIISLNNTSRVKNFTISNLLPLSIIYGSNEFKKVAHDNGYGILMPDDIPKERKPWYDLVNEDFKTDSDALDLLDKMMKLSQDDRVTAEEALSHPYFDSLKSNFC
ncbi:unnamed protein product [Moneuplotes crassus]|uniref:non-specific serine/threonine protein kinase n=2 Tax=Euplotes crassus TaxID=5936 RepID=A0AAD1XGB1_EUPCR|nr:unnamed protein product [Moneuplotes crassus]